MIAKRTGELRLAVIDAHEAADEFHADIVKRVEIECCASLRAGQLQGRHATGAIDVVDLVIALIQDACRIHPPFDIAAAIDSGRADVLAHRHGDLTAGFLKLVGKLGAGGRSADHQHPAFRYLRRVAVFGSREHLYPCGNLGSAFRHVCYVAGAGRDDDGLTLPFALIGCHQIAVIGLLQGFDFGVCFNRRGDHIRIAFDEGDGLGHVPVAVGIVALIAVTGQAALPIRRQKAERVPALGLPGVGDFAALEHDMIDGALGQAPAHRQARMAGADYDRRDLLNETAPKRTKVSSPRQSHSSDW